MLKNKISHKDLGDQKTARMVFNDKIAKGITVTEDFRKEWQDFATALDQSVKQGTTQIAVINVIGALYDIVKFDAERMLILMKLNPAAATHLKVRVDWLAGTLEEIFKMYETITTKNNTRPVIAAWTSDGKLLGGEVQTVEKEVIKEVVKKEIKEVIVEKNAGGVVKFEKIEKLFRHKQKGLNQMVADGIEKFLEEVKSNLVK